MPTNKYPCETKRARLELELLDLLQTNPGLNGAEIQRKMGFSRAYVRELLTDLKKAECVINRQKGWYIAPLEGAENPRRIC